MYSLHSYIATNSVFPLVLAIFVAATWWAFNNVYQIQQTPYLDEIFHIPQAQKYCKGQFLEWDQKITTLPGLYLLSIGLLTPISRFIGVELCDVYYLRCTNLVGSILNFILLYAIQQRIQPAKDNETTLKNIISNVSLATFPVLYFFTFLYYTDTLSTSLVLLTYLLHLHHMDFMASLAGLVSIVVRQTNVIWVIFVAAEAGFEVLKSHAHRTKRKKHARSNVDTLSDLKMLLRTGVQIAGGSLGSRAALLADLAKALTGYALVGVAFAAFVIVNGGIVVGDKSAHEAVLHFPQLFYFCFFATFFSSPFFCMNVKHFIVSIMKHKKMVILVVPVCAAIVHYNTLAHPYLLADNRHYTFYIWRRLYERHFLVRYMLIPVYLFGALSIARSLSHKDITFRINFLVCVILCLVPQKLLEFRYYIVPYLIMRLNMCTRPWWQYFFEFCLYFFINFATVRLFLTRVFYWDGSEDAQRFLW